MGALVGAFRLRLRLPLRRSRARARRRAPGPGDRSGQRQPRQRVTPGALSVPSRGRTRDPLAAFDYVTLAIRNFHDSGHTANMRVAQAMLAVLFDRLGRYEAAATIAGFAFSPLTAALPEFSTAIAHLRDVLGDQTYESLARKGETMTTAAIATYAYDQIDQARTELNAVSK